MLLVKIWLKALIVIVVSLIIVGGATRLTHSGLSITEWKPWSILPPTTKQIWNQEFTLYKNSPEYKHFNQGISLDEFKCIYWWEYSHRLLAKFLGLLALIPLVFLFRDFPIWFRKQYISILLLVCCQGAIGWWMVKSGLKSNPTVCHFRLSVHLLVAFTILSLLNISLWKVEGRSFNKKRTFQNTALLLIVGITIIYGSLVAGLKAGLIYNTFPLMDAQWIPSEWNFYHPLWVNFFNNQATVQWTHRLLAIFSGLYILVLWTKYRSNYQYLALITLFQITIGIVTLILNVPLGLALTHQACAVFVWLACLKSIYTQYN